MAVKENNILSPDTITVIQQIMNMVGYSAFSTINEICNSLFNAGQLTFGLRRVFDSLR